ncbi:MAG: PA14 domain-containing protein, partial [Caldilineaceae bacterium]
GLVPVRVEYFEATQSASIQFTWQLLGSGGSGGGGGGSGGGDGGSSCEQDSRWRSEFWNNDRFSGNPVVTRRDDRIDFNWGLGSPDPAINNDFFTARFTRRICVGEGRTRFIVEVDDGARLFVDGRLLIDSWIPQARNRYEASINLDEGRHTVVLEYLERTSVAEVFLRIDAPAPPNPPRPIGNLITCVPPQPQNNAFVRLYRLDGNNRWVSMGRGSASIVPSGFLKIDGLPVDTGRFGDQGEPYKIQIFWDGQVVRSTGDFLAGEPEFRMRPFVDNQTSWGCFH